MSETRFKNDLIVGVVGCCAASVVGAAGWAAAEYLCWQHDLTYIFAAALAIFFSTTAILGVASIAEDTLYNARYLS